MQIVDLTHKITADMTVYPGTKPPVIEEICSLEKHGFREKRVTFFSHTGTHLDAPAHMLLNGKTLDQFNLDTYYGKACLYEHDLEKGTRISLQHLSQHSHRLENVDFLLIATGWEKFWGKSEYYKDFPTLDIAAAEWLTRHQLKGIGIDAISVDGIDSSDFPVHTVLLGHDLIIVENLTNLQILISNNPFTFACMPLNIENADGSPVRAIALVD